MSIDINQIHRIEVTSTNTYAKELLSAGIDFPELTLVDAETNSTPAVAEYPLTLECKVLYTQKQDLALIPEEIRRENYPQDVDGTNPLANRDPHTAYIGRIVNAYIIR